MFHKSNIIFLTSLSAAALFWAAAPVNSVFRQNAISVARFRASDSHRPTVKVSSANLTDICRNFAPHWQSRGARALVDSSIFRPDHRSPFKSRSEIVVINSGCGGSSPLPGYCAFRLSASDGIRVIATDRYRNYFVLHDNDEWVTHLQIDSNGIMKSMGQAKLDPKIGDVISNYNYTDDSNVHSFISRISGIKNTIDIKVSESEKLFAFYFAEDGVSYMTSRNSDLKLTWVGPKQTEPLEAAEPDLYDLNLELYQFRSVGVVGRMTEAGVIIRDEPFKTAAGFGEALNRQQFSFGIDGLVLDRSASATKITDTWRFQKDRFGSVSCAPQSGMRYRVENHRIGRLSLKVFVPLGANRKSPVVLYFFGGPSGQVSNEIPGLLINEQLNRGSVVVVPYGSGAVGAGVETSRRVALEGETAFATDAQQLKKFLDRNYERSSYSIVGFSYGAVGASKFTSFYPKSVRSLVLVAPFLKSRPPSEYRSGARAIAYQSQLEQAWFGPMIVDRNVGMNGFLDRLYARLADSNVRYSLVFGSVDKISPIEFASPYLRAKANQIIIKKADHQLISMLPEVTQFVSSELAFDGKR